MIDNPSTENPKLARQRCLDAEIRRGRIEQYQIQMQNLKEGYITRMELGLTFKEFMKTPEGQTREGWHI